MKPELTEEVLGNLIDLVETFSDFLENGKTEEYKPEDVFNEIASDLGLQDFFKKTEKVEDEYELEQDELEELGALFRQILNGNPIEDTEKDTEDSTEKDYKFDVYDLVESVEMDLNVEINKLVIKSKNSSHLKCNIDYEMLGEDVCLTDIISYIEDYIYRVAEYGIPSTIKYKA